LLNTEAVKTNIKQMTGEPLLPWEEEYLNYHALRYQETLGVLGPGEGRRLLDVGAFPGHLSLSLKAMGFQVEALTGRGESPRFLEGLIRRLSKQQIPVALADVEFELFPYPDKSFDVVLATEILEHLPFNPFHMLQESFRVLKPSGKLVLSTPNLVKIDNLLRFASGRTIHPDIRLPFFKTFKSILIGRHIREFTADELVYMLEEQNKAMYRFGGTKISYSLGLDPAFSWRGAAVWLIKRIWPRFRATLWAMAFRLDGLAFIDPNQVAVTGFYGLEEHPADFGSTGRILATPFRWTQKQALMELPAGESAFQVFYLHLCFMAPRQLPATILNLFVSDTNLGRVSFYPNLEYTLLRIDLTKRLANEGRFSLKLESTTWRPADHPQGGDYYEYSTSDDRDLGLAVGWDGFLREDCPDLETLKKVAQRECQRESLHQGSQPYWSPLMGLYLIQAEMKPALLMGPDDWHQLGTGWHPLERWPQGWIRWTRRFSEAYLVPGQNSNRLSVRVYTGDPLLGKEVTGSLEIEYAEDKLAFKPVISRQFRLPGDAWQDLDAALPGSLSPEGLTRVILRVDPPRVPALLIPGSQDTRELGLAVSSLALL
jgi:2-polyprenyl-3-methyl-5-hydroxy-6-metoxy-1,4-benzoquinol methylase